MNQRFYLLSSVVFAPNLADSEGCSTWLIIVIIVIILSLADQDSENKHKTSNKPNSNYSVPKTSTRSSTPSPTRFHLHEEGSFPPYDDEIDEILSKRDEILWAEKYQNKVIKPSQINHTDSFKVPLETPKKVKTSTPAPILSNNNQNQVTRSETRKTDWHSFDIIVQNNNIKYLYHFTDMSNLRSIIEHSGLYSWRSCLIKRIRIARPGGNDWSRQLDVQKSLDDYIHLAFNKDHPMLYVAKNEGRILRPIILRIDPSVIFWNSTLFSDQNAASTQASIGGTISDFRKINFHIACGSTWTGPTEKSSFQAEVLVHSHIPLEYISF